MCQCITERFRFQKTVHIKTLMYITKLHVCVHALPSVCLLQSQKWYTSSHCQQIHKSYSLGTCHSQTGQWCPVMYHTHRSKGHNNIPLIVRVSSNHNPIMCRYTLRRTFSGVFLGISLRISTHLFSGTALTLPPVSSSWRILDSKKKGGGGTKSETL